MFSRYKVRNIFGQSFTICLSASDRPLRGLHEQKFSNQFSAARFLRNLIVPENYWRQLIFHMDGKIPDDNNNSILHQVSLFFLRGKIKIYEVDQVNLVDDSSEEQIFKQHNGASFQIVPASMLLNESPVDNRNFVNADEAIKYIRAAAPDEKQLRAISRLVETTKGDNTVTVAGNEDKLLAQLGEAIVAGKVAVVEVKTFSPPPPEPLENAADPREDQKAPLTPDLEKKWCHLIVKEKKDDGKLVPVKASISFILPSGAEKDATTDVNGAASVGTSDQQGSFDIKQVETLHNNIIFEFVSLA